MPTITLIFIALAAAIALLAVSDNGDQDRTEMLRAAIVPLILGITALGFVHLRRPS